MEHSFNTNIAKKYGVNSAIIFNHLNFWILKNKANGVNNYDNNWWTYNSTRAFKEIFDYMSERQIQHALQKLIDGGLIITGNYNKVAYDRTLWYAITDYGKCILQNCQMDLTNMSNGFNTNVEPIPDNNHIENTDSNNIYRDIVAFMNETFKTNFSEKRQKTKDLIKARLNEGNYTLDDFKKVIINKNNSWGKDEKMKQYLRPDTLFGNKFEGYLNEASPKIKTITEHDKEFYGGLR